jgi:hypothetical protein
MTSGNTNSIHFLHMSLVISSFLVIIIRKVLISSNILLARWNTFLHSAIQYTHTLDTAGQILVNTVTQQWETTWLNIQLSRKSDSLTTKQSTFSQIHNTRKLEEVFWPASHRIFSEQPQTIHIILLNQLQKQDLHCLSGGGSMGQLHQIHILRIPGETKYNS